MQTKLSQVKQYMADGNYHTALRLAASFPRLGDHREPITRGWAALTNPGFYREIECDPDELVAAGLDAIRERWNI